MSESIGSETTGESNYKEVMLGPKTVRVPVSWSVEKIGSPDITNKIKAGGTPKATNEEYYDGDIKYVKIEDMSAAGKYITSTENHLTKEGLDSTSTWLVPEDSLLLSMYGSYGKVAITCDEMATNQAILGIIPSNSIDLDYLYYGSSRLKSYFESVVLETTQANLNKGIVEDTPILIPPLPEQRRIADILSTVDEQIQQTDEIIEETKNLKRGLVQDLIFFGKSHNGTQTVQLGPMTTEIAESWDIATVGEVTTKAQYGSSESLSTEGKYPVFRMNNIEDGKMVSSPMKYSDLDEEQAEKYQVEKGDILFNRTNSIDLVGKSGIFDLEGEYIFASYLIRLRTNEKMNPYFLNYYLNSHIGQGILYSIATRGASQANINATNLKRVNVPVPPREQQDRIVEQIQKVEEKIEREEETKQDLQELKRGLMQDLLTGKVRVNAD